MLGGIVIGRADSSSAPQDSTTKDTGLHSNQSVFLEAWTQAIKATTTGEAIPTGHWLALDMLNTLAMECHDPILRRMTYQAIKKTPSQMHKHAVFVAHHDRYTSTRIQYYKEKEIIPKSQKSWEWLDWKLSKDV